MMVEVLEYALVVLASSLFAGASVSALGLFSAFEGSLSQRSSAAAVAGLAWEAIQNGTASGTVPMKDGTISCFQGNLTVSGGGEALSREVPASCHFSLPVLAGSRVVSFSFGDGVLTARVR